MRIFRFRDVTPQLANILFRRRLKFHFEMLPFEATGLSAKKILNFFVAGMNQFILPAKPLGVPVIAQVEPTNFCNLSCPLCLTASETQSRPRALLAYDTFKKLMDEVGDYLLLIILWNWGEPFLNPDIFRMIECAKSKGILVHSSTNGNIPFDDATAEKLVDSGLDSLVFGVDGATQETYGKYRKGGRLDHVLANIRTIVRAKRRKKSETPRLNLRFVVMRHNEKELPAMRQLAKELEVDFFTLKTVDMPPPRGEQLDRSYAPETEKYRRYEYEDDGYQRKRQAFVCMRPWKRFTLDAMGEVISCEYDYENLDSFGSINGGASPVATWKSEKARDFRRRFNRGDNDFRFCRDCTYKDRVAEDCVVERVQLGDDDDVS